MHLQHPRRPARRFPVAMIVSVAAASIILAVSLVVVAVAYSRSPEAAGWDSATIRACEQARGTTGGVDRKAVAAIRAAADSDQAELRQAAARYLDEPDLNALDMRESVLRVAQWCLENGLN